MADRFDPIDDGSTPSKRRKLNSNGGPAWDSGEDDGEDFTENDFQTAATLPISTQQKRYLHYTPAQFHSDIGSPAGQRSSQPSYTTQPTQPLNRYVTQPTQPMQRSPEIQVQRSSPLAASPQRPTYTHLHPSQRPPPFGMGRPVGHFANMIAPPGTAFARPPGVQARPPAINLDDDEDPPVHHSDDESQGLTSKIKPTNFKKAGRGLDSSPNRTIIRESPQQLRAPIQQQNTPFLSLISQFEYGRAPPNWNQSNDMAGAYGNVSRPPRPQQHPPYHTHPKQLTPARALQASSHLVGGPVYNRLADVQDYNLRNKIQEMQTVLRQHSVHQCMIALSRSKGNTQDAMDWLVTQDEQAQASPDELSSLSPVQKKGVANRTSQFYMSQPSQPVRPAAKQQVQAKQSIAEKYRRKPMKKIVDSDEDSEQEENDDMPRKGRMLQGRPENDAPSPPSSPPLVQKQLRKRLNRKPMVIESDDDDDSGVGKDASDTDGEVEEVETTKPNAISEDVHELREQRVLKLLNENTAKDLAEVTAKPLELIQFVLDKRPFNDLDEVRAIVQETFTKTGKKSKKTKAVGEQLADECIEVMSGYDAVDELVVQCEKIAAPLREALKSWGADSTDGELQLMKLDEAHDSGVGTPASSCNEDSAAQKGTKNGKKGKWYEQPKNMNQELPMKDYQLVGLNWLHMLFEKKLSCILADDMGLGKTCQIIGFLSQLKLEEVDGVHLVICPGSTLENWLREFERFAPEMNVRPYYGTQKERPEIQQQIIDEWTEIDVIVTTYDMAVAKDDNKFLRNQGPWAVVVYDEAHMLRNPNSNRYGQLTRIGADFKVLLTGTPLQNNLQELIAILAFIMPEMFQEKRDDLDFLFKHKASTKDTANTALLSGDRIARARSMMTPFILRRKKAQVLDLPKKDSRVEYCEMTASQAEFYAELRETAQRIFAEKRLPGAKKDAKASSNVIMSLRKAAIHPLLSRRIFDDKKLDKMVTALSKSEEFGSNTPEKIRAYLDGTAAQCIKGGDFGLHKFCTGDYALLLSKRFALKKEEWMDSGKINKFKELVTKFAENGDRLLVFSQFTTLMDILEAVLETLKIKFMRLDGSTDMSIRQEMIDKFTNEDDIPVFMLSTKAGGAGINLAAANKVIIFDSGFNPQDDIQAENRAHRVGQTREVEVVRLVTKGTIEEQIHALGVSKLALDERVAGEGEGKDNEKQGEKMVEDMLAQDLTGKKEADATSTIMCDSPKPSAPVDLKDAFKLGMEDAGVKVASKQAQF